jgi:hypothetical protein
VPRSTSRRTPDLVRHQGRRIGQGRQLYRFGYQFTGAEALDQAYVPFFGAFGTACDDAMVARRSANPLGMPWPGLDAAFVTSGGVGTASYGATAGGDNRCWLGADLLFVDPNDVAQNLPRYPRSWWPSPSAGGCPRHPMYPDPGVTTPFILCERLNTSSARPAFHPLSDSSARGHPSAPQV